ncbi:MAG: response regulator [Candidatus Latescibacterota bacterium]|jgi:CheY-like chemotaxis protein
MPAVVIVDADPGSRRELTQTLSEDGWEVWTYASAAEALARLPHLAVDLLVTEVHLPDLPAWDLIPRLRALDPDLPVVALTADEAWETSRRVRVEAGPVFYYALKPVDPQELRGVARSAARWRHRHDPPATAPRPMETRR